MQTQPATTWLQRVMRGNIVKQILAGLILGILLSWLSPDSARAVGLLGTLFVGALKSVAPVLVLVLVMASVANHRQGQKISIRPILLLYLIGTFSAALTAVIVSFLFPSGYIWWRRDRCHCAFRYCRRAGRVDEYRGKPCRCAGQRELHRHPGLGGWSRLCPAPQ
jgi:Na+/serine symporter